MWRRRSPHDPVRDRPCWPAGGCCSTTDGCRTANRTSQAPHGSRRTTVGAPPPKSVPAEDDLVSVSTERGVITLPLEVTDMDDGTVWLPLNSPGSAVYQQLGVTAGDVVSIGRATR